MSNPRVYFDVAIDGKAAGRIEFELFANVVPKTAGVFSFLLVYWFFNIQYLVRAHDCLPDCAHTLYYYYYYY